jgi:hypothetical protein
MNLSRKINFGKIDAEGRGRKINSVDLVIELRNADTNKPEFSVCGDVWNGRHTDIVQGGQCIDSIDKFFKNDRLYKLIENLWKKHHLNSMHAGTVEQENCLKDFASEKETIRNELRNNAWNKAKIEYNYPENHFKEWQNWNGSKWDSYTVDCELLKRHGLYEVEVDGKPYKYGHSWLYRAIPESDLNKIRAILDKDLSVDFLYKEDELYK